MIYRTLFDLTTTYDRKRSENKSI